MADYDNIAPFYDRLHGSRKQTIAYVKQLIRQYHPAAETILSLACGTGAVVKGLKKYYHMEGLDLSPGMIERARKKNKGVTFYVDNMCTFNLDKKYDVITCLYASLNHVVDFDQWCAMFHQVKKHLNPGGVFIFDVISEVGLYNMVLNSPLIIKRWRQYSIGEISMGQDGSHSIWRARGFKKPNLNSKVLYDVTVKQVAYPLELIEKALSREFSDIFIDDPEQGEVDERSEIYYFMAMA